jgi:beta-glucoside operon transcriptional antiterminator
VVAFFYIKVIRRMIFLKTFNNSAALVQDDQGQEQVVLGKGVGFGLKKGDKIDEK